MTDTLHTYLVEARLARDAGWRRGPVRDEHLGRLRRLIAEGRVIAAGALDDMSGSILLVRATNEAEAEDIVGRDVYIATGVWTAVVIRSISLVEP